MDKNYYIQYYDLEREHWWFRVREKIILDKIRGFIGKTNSAAPIKILNVGVATGRSSEALSAVGEVTSIEYDVDCWEYTKARTGLEIINASILDIPFEDNSFDMVCSFDVVEHVQEDSLAVSELKRVCKDGGVVFITVPALMSLWSHHDVVNHHVRRYKIGEIDKLFNTPKDKIILRSYFNSLLFPPIYMIRMVTKLFPKLFKREESESDFSLLDQNSIGNRIAYMVFLFERFLLNYINFGIGISIMYAIRK
jgi:SAM-dependent methyltransferase